MSEEFEYYQWVARKEVASYVRAGWELLGLAPGHHGVHALTVRWKGSGEPPAPITAYFKED